jgi:hypothetical protein
MARRDALFTTIRTEGGLLPTDLLALIAQGDKSVPGVNPQDYHLVKGELFGARITDSWNRLRNAWKDFSARLAAAPEDDAGTTLTRDKWLQILFKELEYGQLPTQRALKVDDKEFPVSHGWGQVPIHLISAKLPIDRRTPGARGAAGASPHSMVQELLNRSDQHLWAFVSNGRVLRILRDNASLTRQAFVEFDLEAMFSDEVYEDFVVLWRTCHQSRVEAENPQDFWLEQWTKVAAETGTRARDDLRGGVEAAIEALGTGFVAHPANGTLKERLRSGDLDSQDLYRQLLRLIYRLLFLFVAEDRDLLHPPGAALDAQRRYQRFYSLNRIRNLAGRRRGGPHPDLWSSLTVVFDGLGRPDGISALALPGLGSFLWSPAACPDLDRSQISNQLLLAAVRHIGFVEDRNEGVRRPIDYRNLGTEELGAIYESLLEQHPEVNTDAGTFNLNTAAGNERKTTGSYYTPTSLITELLESTVDPVLDEACKQSNPEEALLKLSVIDPACGSGHFLIAAAHRIAKRLAAVRTGDDEPSPDATRTALRDVIARCIHGIDLNPMAVELCKVSLWMESMEPGKPLGFLDHRIVRGNGLIGATPELLDAGVPDEAFKPLTGDDKVMVTSLKKRNKQARAGQQSLFAGGVDNVVGQIAGRLAEIDRIDDTDLTAVITKAARWSELVNSPEYQAAVHAADTWCAAFVSPKTPASPVITHEEFVTARDNPGQVQSETSRAVDVLAEQYAFLHWHLAFPDVHTKGGFDLVLGNPPWDQLQYDPQEIFAATHPAISNAPNMAKRNQLLRKLADDEPSAYSKHLVALRHVEAVQHFVHESGCFPLASFGRLNTATLFVERGVRGTGTKGLLGLIVPTGMATDSFSQHLFRWCMSEFRLVSFISFENEEFIFPGVHHAFKFSLLTLSGGSRPDFLPEFIFFARSVAETRKPERRFSLSVEDLQLINPNSKTAPIFRTARDAELTKDVYRRLSAFDDESSTSVDRWKLGFQLMFMMNEASNQFSTRTDLVELGAITRANYWEMGSQQWLPLLEAKMIQQFNHRFGDFDMKDPSNKGTALPEVGAELLRNPTYVNQPRYWMPAELVSTEIRQPEVGWLLGFRDVTNATNERTLIAATLPPVAVGHNMPTLNAGSPLEQLTLLSLLNSFALDFFARQKMGGTHMTLFVLKQLPAPLPSTFRHPTGWSGQPLGMWIGLRAVELSYTSWDLGAVGAAIDYSGPPFNWDTARRELLRAELDAAFFHLYGIDRDDVEYIMDTFPIVKRKDEAAHGEYRTKRLILERYDALAVAAASGTEYQTVLNPPPADPSCAHPESTRPDWARSE